MKMEDCTVEENVQIAKDTYKMKIKGNFVKECRTPGQFVNIRIGDGREYMLRRPISISEIDRGENLVTIIYRIVGEGTKFMADIKKGNEIDIMGQRWIVVDEGRLDQPGLHEIPEQLQRQLARVPLRVVLHLAFVGDGPQLLQGGLDRDLATRGLAQPVEERQPPPLTVEVDGSLVGFNLPGTDGVGGGDDDFHYEIGRASCRERV